MIYTFIMLPAAPTRPTSHPLYLFPVWLDCMTGRLEGQCLSVFNILFAVEEVAEALSVRLRLFLASIL